MTRTLLWILLSVGALATVGWRLGADALVLALAALLAVVTLIHAIIVPGGPSLPGMR